MAGQAWYFILLGIFGLSFFGSFLSALVFYFLVLKHTKPGETAKPLIHPFWWVPSNAERILKPEGMVNYRRMLRTLAFGAVMGLAIILLSAVRVAVM